MTIDVSTDPVTVRYDGDSRHWSSDADLNTVFLTSQLNYCRDRLRARGHLFLNEVFDNLGLRRTSQGALVGWLWEDVEENDVFWNYETSSSQDHVDITLYIQGVIYDKI